MSLLGLKIDRRRIGNSAGQSPAPNGARRRPYFSAGFTLIETVVCIAVFVLVFAVLTSFVIWLYQSVARFKTINEVASAAQEAIETISHEVRAARSIYYPTSNQAQLSLETGRYLPPDEISSYIDFFLCDDRLCLKKESELPLAITSHEVTVESLRFSYLATSSDIASVRVVLSLKAKTEGAEQPVVSVTSSIALRNY